MLLLVVVTAGFIALHGLLWYAHPSPGVWLVASLGLGLLWGITFLRLITREGLNE